MSPTSTVSESFFLSRFDAMRMRHFNKKSIDAVIKATKRRQALYGQKGEDSNVKLLLASGTKI